jgi:hypothetical protein
LSISVRKLAKLVEPTVKLARWPTRVNAVFKVHGWLQSLEEGALQQSVRPSSALTRLHWVHVLTEL